MVLDNVRSCPICTSEPKEEFRARNADVLKCGNRLCGHIYAKRATALQGVQAHPSPEVECDQYRDRNNRLTRFFLGAGFIGPGSTILDFGSGVGHIDLVIRDMVRDVDITCIEADSSAQGWLLSKGLRVVRSFSECPSNARAVLLIEVIEHLDSPIEVLREIKGLLAPGGKIFISTPCGETRSGDRRTNAYDAPEHIHFFTELSLSYAIRAAGFSSIEFRTVNEMYPRGSGGQRVLADIKDLLRPMRDKIKGYHHLIGFVQ